MNKQDDLFANDHSIVGQLFDNLDNIPEAEIFHKWPRTLTEMIELMTSELVRQGETKEEAQKKASKLTGLLAYYFGGQSFYLPTGTVLKDALRNVQIYNEFKGNNVPDLVKKYNLSESHIYAIIREQRTLSRKRYQRDLFEVA
ncbi:Mor transcription activator family protein [Pasteurella multocida]|uniref:Mor transcription activator family protein n=1 Tax=Pasteurella TaxID=745 RepID=UPI0029AED897|nr:transcriptional regulator [Pasteurella multocida]HEH9663184.1 transcriptional regulator [Pasteurella multocida]HEH9676822.1 transcriptional regulator [Pasteurella multocida]HEH9690166.1 transcriptional regulator [Pasteurella multocida]HEH9699366.1 transcriptional regulator [Pasteurella multocida]